MTTAAARPLKLKRIEKLEAENASLKWALERTLNEFVDKPLKELEKSKNEIRGSPP